MSLDGVRVAVTRASAQAGGLKAILEERGAEVLELPLIFVTPDAEPQTVADVFAEIASYEWVIFTSVNGVNGFFHFFDKSFKDLRCFGGARIACVGAATKKAVESYRLEVDLVPEEAVAEALAESLIAYQDIESVKMLVVTGNRNGDALPKILEEKGRAIVDKFPVYRTDYTDLEGDAAADSFRKHGADVITFTSSSTVDSFVAQAKHLQIEASAKKPKACSIGPVTSETMRAKGMPVDAEAKEATLEALADAVEKVSG